MRRAPAWLVLGAVIVALVSACGGAAKSTTSVVGPPTITRAATPYERAMQRLGLKLSSTLRSIARTNSTTSATTDVTNLERVQRELNDTAAQLARIVPPAKIAAPHALLLRGVREYAQELTGVIGRLQKGELGALHLIPSLRGVKDMGRASREIANAGYDIIG